MENKGLLLFSQEFTPYLYPEPDGAIPHPSILFL